MTKDEAARIASTIEGPYLELWKQAFAVLDPGKTVLADPATRSTSARLTISRRLAARIRSRSELPVFYQLSRNRQIPPAKGGQ